MDRKLVLVYSGPPASGKTTQMQKLAAMRGINFRKARWPIIHDIPQVYWKYLQKDAEGVEYLFIDDYDLSNKESNLYLHELSLLGIMIVVASQTTLTNQISESLPASFRITRCNYQMKEVSHA